MLESRGKPYATAHTCIFNTFLSLQETCVELPCLLSACKVLCKFQFLSIFNLTFCAYLFMLLCFLYLWSLPAFWTLDLLLFNLDKSCLLGLLLCLGPLDLHLPLLLCKPWVFSLNKYNLMTLALLCTSAFCKYTSYYYWHKCSHSKLTQGIKIIPCVTNHPQILSQSFIVTRCSSSTHIHQHLCTIAYLLTCIDTQILMLISRDRLWFCTMKTVE